MAFFELLPTSCTIRPSLESTKEEENKTGIVIKAAKTFKYDKIHAGKKRTFSITIYKISKKDNPDQVMSPIVSRIDLFKARLFPVIKKVNNFSISIKSAPVYVSVLLTNRG